MKSIVIPSQNGRFRERVDAHVIGDWMANRIPSFDVANAIAEHGWRVSHRCGAAIAGIVDDLTEHDAISIARSLSACLPDFPDITATEVQDRKGMDFEEWGYIVQAVVAEALEGPP